MAKRFAEVQHAQDVKGTIKRLTGYFSGQKMLLAGVLSTVVLSTVLGILAPSLQSRAIDIIAGAREGRLLIVLAIMFATYLLSALGSVFQGRLGARLSMNIVSRMRNELFGKVIDLPINYVDTHSHGDLMSRMTNDVESISSTVSSSLTSLIAGILTIIGTVSVMFAYCWQLALLSFSTVGFTILATKLLSGKIRDYSRQKQQYLGMLNSVVEETVTGYKTVVAYNYQDETIDEFNRSSDSLTRSGIKADTLSGVMGPLMNSIGNIGFVIIAAFGGWFAIKGMISVGVISAFIVYAKQFSRPINQLAQIYGSLQTAVAGAERVFKVIDEPSEDKTGNTVPDKISGHVRFEDVDFSYVPGRKVIQGFSLDIPAGHKIALVGSTGCGKTTIVNLLLRFYSPDSGKISVDGTDIMDIPSDELRKDIAIVLQETVLFSDTIRGNLHYANANATEEQVEKAARLSHCEEFIANLPDGMDTMLSASGSNISQGQRQLLAIARACAADPRILILDEATSSVDTRTEKDIQDAMARVMNGRTSIVIAHRLSTIRDADTIVVMDKGRIVESGNHEQLLALGGKYHELYMTQFAGFAT